MTFELFMKPIQYIKGFVEWYKLKLKVTPDVLIPRPETELLVDEVLKRVKSNELRVMNENGNSTLNTLNSELVILDLGTGSGNIAIALAKNLSLNLRGGNVNPDSIGVNIIATDISDKALKVAKQNARLHGVEKRIKFIQSDLFESVIPSVVEGSQDVKDTQQIATSSRINIRTPRNDSIRDYLIIVTNLPYIPSGRIPTLDSSVKDFEPYIALDGGENGFALYEKLFSQIKEQGLNLDLLVGEIDYTHAELAVSIAKKYFPEMEIEVKKDLAKMPRILSIKKIT